MAFKLPASIETFFKLYTIGRRINKDPESTLENLVHEFYKELWENDKFHHDFTILTPLRQKVVLEADAFLRKMGEERPIEVLAGFYPHYHKILDTTIARVVSDHYHLLQLHHVPINTAVDLIKNTFPRCY